MALANLTNCTGGGCISQSKSFFGGKGIVGADNPANHCDKHLRDLLSDYMTGNTLLRKQCASKRGSPL
eukprot:13566518-Ditylum_brightwellii.AAC.1